jgi:hypothetical protein
MTVTSVAIKMRWKWGGGKVISCSSAMTLEEIAREYGFAQETGPLPIFIADGEILSPEFTLHWLQIASGQTIIAYSANPETRRVSTRMFKGRDSYVQGVRNEASRIVDMGFRKWENNRSFPRVLRQLHDQELAKEGQPAYDYDSTIVAASGEISDEPLPQLNATNEKLCVTRRHRRTDSL